MSDNKKKSNYIRINNVEYKETVSLTGGEPYEEIVLWYKNKYFNAQEKYKSDGWAFDKEGNASKDNCHIDGKLFKSEELCCVVAFVEWNSAHDEFDIKSVGTRAFELEESDYRDFKRILKLIEEMAYED